ncbi:hypothetical protein NDU88_002452 [Pleurodeles waltl]|uniref:Uncharacterized protein n=1 Tax=Pleurodeles waltl TaxID=8319 RepID=A0AAV7TKK8_PLEWA|nr:hypothetical protein NDU88_002452 [Pleurodeles waltl]
MPGSRTVSKQSGKPSRQLLFSEALRHQRVPPAEENPFIPPSSMAEPTQGATMNRILQEISAVGLKLEDQRVTTVETRIASWVDRDKELLYLQSKLIDLEDRSRRDNVCFLGFPEIIEGEDAHPYLRETLPKLTGITFDPPLESQTGHRLGPKRRDDGNRPAQS